MLVPRKWYFVECTWIAFVLKTESYLRAINLIAEKLDPVNDKTEVANAILFNKKCSGVFFLACMCYHIIAHLNKQQIYQRSHTTTHRM